MDDADDPKNSVPFEGRPGGSPVIAALLAAGVIRTSDRVLDLCCGRGPDALLLGSGGVEYVRAIDTERAFLTQGRRTAREHEITDRVKFIEGDLVTRLRRFADGSINVVVDTLSMHNAREQQGKRAVSPGRRRKRTADIIRQIARVLQTGGLWVMQGLVDRHFEDEPYAPAEPSIVFPSGSARYFDLSPAYPSHLAEYHRKSAAERACKCPPSKNAPLAGLDEPKLKREFGFVYVAIGRRLNKPFAR